MTGTDGIPYEAGKSPGGAAASQLQWWVLNENQWRTLRGARLTALKESPQSFLSRYEVEANFGERRWRDEFSHGEWIIVGEEGKAIKALIGVVRGYDIPSADRYLEYLWVSPGLRRSKLATNLINAVLRRLEASGTGAVWLWILDGNEPARELYNKCGFITTGERHRPQANPSLWEERMNLRLNPRSWEVHGIRLSLERSGDRRTPEP
jgi:ribosomal protein S18 acetylase RimI-like enzyme